MDTEYDDPPYSNHAGERANAYMVVEHSRMTPLLIAITCCSMLVAGIAFGFALKADARADAAERKANIATMRTEGFTRALIARDIDPYPHIEGEPR